MICRVGLRKPCNRFAKTSIRFSIYGAEGSSDHISARQFLRFLTMNSMRARRRSLLRDNVSAHEEGEHEADDLPSRRELGHLSPVLP